MMFVEGLTILFLFSGIFVIIVSVHGRITMFTTRTLLMFETGSAGSRQKKRTYKPAKTPRLKWAIRGSPQVSPEKRYQYLMAAYQ